MRRRALAALLIGAFVLVALLAPHAAAPLVVHDPPAAADATLLTYSVNSFARPDARQSALNAAADRFARGDGPHVLISAFRSQDEEFRTHSSLATRHLLRRGVPQEHIELLPDVSSEYEEGRAVSSAALGRGWTRLAVLASDFRSRRTAGTLRRALSGSGVEVLIITVADPALDLRRWWQTPEGIEAVAGEYLRLGYYFAAGRL